MKKQHIKSHTCMHIIVSAHQTLTYIHIHIDTASLSEEGSFVLSSKMYIQHTRLCFNYKIHSISDCLVSLSLLKYETCSLFLPRASFSFFRLFISSLSLSQQSDSLIYPITAFCVHQTLSLYVLMY